MNNLQDRNTSYHRSKGIIHIAIGIVYCLISGVIIYAEKNHFIEVGTTFSYIMCGLFAVYGLFRIYRGYRRVSGKETGW